MYMYLRPGLKEFLTETSKHFELVLFNNGSQLYTEAVVQRLMKTLKQQLKLKNDITFFSHILCREQCSTNDKGHEIKNLEFFTGPGSNRDLKDCIIVDNSIFCF